MSNLEKMQDWAKFAAAMEWVKKYFPEHASEIEGAVTAVGRKLDACGDPNCNCRLSSANFRGVNRRTEKNFYEVE